jgi:arylsulfatase A-like enzyme
MRAQSWARCTAHAAGLGLAAGAAIGAAECGKLLWQRAPRYADQAWELLGVGILGYAVLGTLLAAVCATPAWLLWRAPSFRAARASICAGFGALLGLAGFVLVARVGAGFLLPAAVGGTLLCLCLREFLDHVRWPTRPRLWLALGALVLLAGGGVFAVRGGASAGASHDNRAQPGRPNVLLVTIDTLRADHVGAYGASDAHTPTLDALAQQGVLFKDATSQANTTGPSHTTMLTGLYPHDHGARHNGVPISNRVRTLPELLAAQGYQTAAFVSGFTLKQEACGLAPRFDRYDDELIAWTWLPEVATRLRLFQAAVQVANLRGFRALRADRPAEETVARAQAWLAARDTARPFFLWTHFYDPHCPYQPPESFAALHDPDFEGNPARNWYKLSTPQRRALVDDPREVAHMRALYKGEISYTDAQLGRLFDSLRASGVFENTLVVLTSDHGEGLGEHGYWFDHGTYLYDSELAVPLILRLPNAQHAGRRIDTQVRLLDLTPTVLAALGLEVPANLNGSSLLGTLDGDGDPRPSFAQGERSGELSGYDLDGLLLSLRAHGRKLIWNSEYWLDSVRVPERLELFELERDPGELEDRFDKAIELKSEAVLDMRTHLEVWRDATAAGAGPTEIAPEVREQLKSLGYL